MKITAINFRAQDTQILSAAYDKSQVVLQDIYTMDSVLKSIISGDTGKMTAFFAKLKKELPNGVGRIFIALPTGLTRINCACGDYDKAADLNSTVEKWKLQILDIGAGEDWYIDIPLMIKRPTKLNITAAAIKKTYIDTLFDAALGEQLYLHSVEPSCVAVMRYIDKWKENYCVLEYDQNELTLCGYHPERGAFVMTDYLFAEINNIGSRLSKLLPLFDFTAGKTFDGFDAGSMAIISTDDDSDLITVLESSSYLYRKSSMPAANPLIDKGILKAVQWAAVFGLALHLPGLKENNN